MPSLLVIAVMLTMFGMAFPPLLILAAIVWWRLWKLGRRKFAAARALEQAKLDKVQAQRQRNYDKAVRYFGG